MRKLAFLLASVTITYACSCNGFQSLEKAFCKVDFVSHAKVVSKFTESGREFQYEIEHMEVFKMPERLSELPTKFTSFSQPERCGLELELGQEYLLSGLIYEDGMSGHLIHCPAIGGLLRKWDRVSEEDIDALHALRTYTCEKNYKISCRRGSAQHTAVKMKRFAFLLLSITTIYADEGICPEFASRKDAFCEYDWVSHVKVTRKVLDADPDIYTLEHIETFRKKEGEPPQTVLSRMPSDGRGGIVLEVGEEYLLAGYQTGSPSPFIADCPKANRLSTKWDDLLESEIEALRTYTCPEST
ncbi:unnamed protein product [Cylicocyclus nassatus]|uniref:NTR domain-containing protein n=1 Tax=Cylicocyclus nassatus TaxID=53992 RepID=A0AA36GY84_CYLNA|nr:unnamed protein product [Cylicocyclus nassatus]